MAQPTIKTSFASGEWAPKLQGRVDIQKYHAGAALLRNWYVDYSAGGASTRQGTKFINQCKARGARLIPFQPSSTLSFVLEFGAFYIRFISNGSYILESAVAIQSITGSPVTVNSTANGYSNGDWVFISGAYYIVTNAATNSYQLTDLFGNNVTSLSGTSAQRVYTLASPYAAADLFANSFTGNPGLKYLQNITSLIITHPNYAPAVLTEIAPNNWTLTNITFTPTIDQPVVTGTPASGSTWNYIYVVTSVDANGQESSASSSVTVNNGLILSTTSPITNKLTWSPVAGAVSYNIYRSAPVFGAANTPTGPALGFIANIAPAAGTSPVIFYESSPGIAPDFSVGPPVSPSSGAGVQKITITNGGSYTTVPSVTISAPPAGGINAAARATLKANSISTGGASILQITFSDANGNAINPVNQAIVNLPNGVVALVASATNPGGTTWNVVSLTITGGGTISSGTAPTTGNVPTSIGSTVSGYTGTYLAGSVTLGWTLGSVPVTQSGSGYLTAPSVTFSAGAGTATATLGATFGGISINPLGTGNPGVPGFFQERLCLAGPVGAVQSYFMSQPAFFYNFNVSFPSADNDAISGTIVGEDLNDIRSLVDSPAGLIALTGKGAWIINGGGGISSQTPITPSNQTANPQAFNGANDLRPIKINKEILYGTNKGNYFRDLTYNIYANIYSGEDITVYSNHLFFGHYSLDWAWSEEPFKTLWVVRDDGILLSLGYVKEQELVGWARHDTDGQFKSACSVIENVNGNIVDAVYFIVERLINGQLVQYVERYADRYFPYGYEDSWSVDCALQTQPASSPAGTLTISGDGSSVGNVVTLSDTADSPFTSGMASSQWVVRAGGGIYKITGFTSTSSVTATVQRVPPTINQYTNVPFPVTTGFSIWQPITTVSGLTQLVGKTVTGVADGAVVSPQVVSASGTITLGSAATKVTLGIAYTPQLKTLPLDLGEPTTQSKRKKIAALTMRVVDTLGLQVGISFSNMVGMRDLAIGAIPSNAVGVFSVTDLVNPSSYPISQMIDAFQVLDPAWQEIGQYCISQPLPYPATIVAIIPQFTMGDQPHK